MATQKGNADRINAGMQEKARLARQRKAHAIGDRFAELLREILTPEEWDAMRAANVANIGTDVCASHDYCDANMPMHAACNSLGVSTDDERALWGEAWDYAKARHLTAQPQYRFADKALADKLYNAVWRLDGEATIHPDAGEWVVTVCAQCASTPDAAQWITDAAACMNAGYTWEYPGFWSRDIGNGCSIVIARPEPHGRPDYGIEVWDNGTCTVSGAGYPTIEAALADAAK